jgi:hypothetical protein
MAFLLYGREIPCSNSLRRLAACLLIEIFFDFVSSFGRTLGPNWGYALAVFLINNHHNLPRKITHPVRKTVDEEEQLNITVIFFI